MPLDRLIFFAPAIFVVLWSTGWISARYAAPHADPLWFLTIRFSCAAIAIALFAFAVRAPWPRGRTAWLHGIVSGVLLHGIYLAGVWWAVKHGLSASISGLLAALQPLLTALLAPYLLNEKITARQWIGVAVGFLGVMLVLSPKLGAALGGDGEAAWAALGVNIIGMLAVTAGSFYQKRFVAAADLRTVTSVQYVGALIIVAPLALATEPLFFDHSLEIYLVLAWSVLVLSVFGFTIMLLMINRGEVTRVSALIYLVPSTVAVMAWLLFGEVLNAVQIGGMLLTAVGVYLATRKEQSP
jgi:drug/metabolite transporter (DMT)-like permease